MMEVRTFARATLVAIRTFLVLLGFSIMLGGCSAYVLTDGRSGIVISSPVIYTPPPVVYGPPIIIYRSPGYGYRYHYPYGHWEHYRFHQAPPKHHRR